MECGGGIPLAEESMSILQFLYFTRHESNAAQIHPARRRNCHVAAAMLETLKNSLRQTSLVFSELKAILQVGLVLNRLTLNKTHS